MRLRDIHKSLPALALALLMDAAHAGDWISAGFRLGGSDVIELEEHSFTLAGAFGIYALPWEWRMASGRPLKTALRVDLDYLNGSGNDAWLLSSGPEFDYRINDTWSLQAGLAVTYISHPLFTGNDLGGQLQFTSHVSARYGLSPDWAMV